MGYIVLARKYRPQTFAEIVGQPQITTTLTNAIASGRLTHAFLFTGPRGVGKTSTARILAKAINCAKAPTSEPCGACDICKEISSGSSLDVIEIDGASNRGIDDIRMLRDGAKFVPIKGKFKVYIIDEVHQITSDAFNALLKTIEEPPPHLKFIFATTEAHKIPLTILSRCQRFDFRRVKVMETIETLQKICKKENIKVSDEALLSIARSSEGSLRDAETLLDQLVSYSATESISNDDVNQLLGIVNEQDCYLFAAAVRAKDASSMLDLLRSVTEKGGDIYRFYLELTTFFRDILVFLSMGAERAKDAIDLPELALSQIASIASDFTKQELFYIIHILTDAIQKMKRNSQVILQAEISALRLIEMPRTSSIDEILARCASGDVNEKKRPNKPAMEPVQEQNELMRSARRFSESKPAENKIQPSSQSAPTTDYWAKISSLVKERSITVGLNLDKARRHDVQGSKLIIGFLTRDMFHKEIVSKPESIQLIEDVATEILKKPIKVDFSDMERPADRNHANGDISARQTQSAKDILDDPHVKGIISSFDAEIVSIEK